MDNCEYDNKPCEFAEVNENDMFECTAIFIEQCADNNA